jgi:hypothetical protein
MVLIGHASTLCSGFATLTQIFNAVTGASLAEEQAEQRFFRPLADWRAILRAAGFVDSYVYEMQVRAAGAGGIRGRKSRCWTDPQSHRSCAPLANELPSQPHDPTIDVMMCFFKPPSEALTWGAPPPPPPPVDRPKGPAAAVQLLSAAASTAALQGGRSLVSTVLGLLPRARAALQQVRASSCARVFSRANFLLVMRPFFSDVYALLAPTLRSSLRRL